MSASWNDFVTAALLGSEKAATPALPAALASAIPPPDAGEKHAGFLTAAGAFALWRRAGWRPGQVTAEIPPADPESNPLVSRASAGHFRAMLGGRFGLLLPEWLNEVVRLQRRVPFELLPLLLETVQKRPELRLAAMIAGGSRAQWLAKHNAQWAFAGTTETPELWETGTRDQRLATLRALRLQDTANARAKVEAVWKEEPADVRVALLTELRSGLSEADASFLETVLDDRSKEVRRIAMDLLARLPQSAFVARMLERAKALLTFPPGKLLSRAKLEVQLPADPDAAAARDGVDPKAFGTQKSLGGKAVMLVTILSAIPLRHWTETFTQPPAALLNAVEKNEFARAVATGWAWAALRQRDVAWAEALLDSGVELHSEFLPDESLLELLPEEARAKRLIPMLEDPALKKGEHPAWAALGNELSTFSNHLPFDLARPFLALLRRVAADGLPWYFRGTIEGLLHRLPPSLLPEAVQGWPMDKEGVAQIVESLTFRHDALVALTSS